jgi:hypothetical protein
MELYHELPLIFREELLELIAVFHLKFLEFIHIIYLLLIIPNNKENSRCCSANGYKIKYNNNKIEDFRVHNCRII